MQIATGYDMHRMQGGSVRQRFFLVTRARKF
jgi:hypothetical protein